MKLAKQTVKARALLLVLVSLSLSHQAISQFAGFGLSGGGSFAEMEHSDQVPTSVSNYQQDVKAGGTGGIKLDFDLGTEYIKLTPEVFIIQNGSKEFYSDFNILQQDVLRRVNLDYVGLLLPINFYLPLNPMIAQHNYHGFMISARFYTDYTINGRFSGDSQGEEIEFKKSSDKIDFGFSVDGGFIVQNVALKFGYNWGIKDIEFNSNLDTSTNGNETYLINNKGFTITIGFMIKTSNRGYSDYDDGY
jgi:hypothetical protein